MEFVDLTKTPRQLADDADEAIRALNHVTMNRRDEWEYPGDAYSVTGSLGSMAARLPQALQQIQRFLNELEREHALSSTHGNLAADLAQVRSGLTLSLKGAAQMLQGLTAAQSGLSSIAYKED